MTPDVNQEIERLATALKQATTHGEHFDVNRLDQLIDMRKRGQVALAEWRVRRFQELQNHTRAIISKLDHSDMADKPDLADQIHEELEKFDVAAVRWFRDEVVEWPDSEAASIAAGILITVGKSPVDGPTNT